MGEPHSTETREAMKQSNNGIRFGLRGWLTTLAGFFLGGVIGIGAIAIIWNDNVLMLIYFRPFAALTGAIWGAFLGVIFGTKKQQ